MTLNYDETILAPLTSDALVQQRVATLVGRACSRQIWFLFLDDSQVQLPLIMPIGDTPIRPDPFVGQLVMRIGEVMEQENADSVIVVLERYADATITQFDRAWARALWEEFEAIDVRVRGILISHRKGIRWFAQDDYLFGPEETAR